MLTQGVSIPHGHVRETRELSAQQPWPPLHGQGTKGLKEQERTTAPLSSLPKAQLAWAGQAVPVAKGEETLTSSLLPGSLVRVTMLGAELSSERPPCPASDKGSQARLAGCGDRGWAATGRDNGLVLGDVGMLGWSCGAREVRGALRRRREHPRTRGELVMPGASGKQLNVHQAGEM